MKNVSKVFALLLAVILVLTMVAPAFAANDTPHTITLTYEKSGHTYVAYQIFKGDIETGKLTNIEWGSGVDGEAVLTDLRAHPVLGADFTEAVTTAEQVAMILTKYENDGSKIEAFGRIVAANLSTTKAGTSTESANGDLYDYAINVNGDGYYIVMDAGEIANTDAATKYILQVLGDVEMIAKADVPVLEKKIDENGTKVDLNEVFVGDKISYVLTSKVPAMDGYNKYFFVINDTMSKGLTFNGDVVVKIGGNALTAGTDYDDFTEHFRIRYQLNIHHTLIRNIKSLVLIAEVTHNQLTALARERNIERSIYICYSTILSAFDENSCPDYWLSIVTICHKTAYDTSTSLIQSYVSSLVLFFLQKDFLSVYLPAHICP
jgi:fimbrial isopeptide formation D2 family protein